MQVYKAFFKIIIKNLNQIMIYVVVFLAFAILLGNMDVNPADTNFEETKINVAFINEDEDSELVEGLREYISKNANIVDISEDDEKLKDALFFRTVEYIVRIPNGFTKEMMGGSENVSIKTTTVPNSNSEMYMNNLINRYLNTVKMYSGSISNLSQEKIVSYVSKDLSESTDVKLSTYDNGHRDEDKCRNYYNYLAYSMFAILILGVSSVMITFNNKDLKMRNSSSALKLKDMNFQMVLGNISYSLLVWVVMIFASFIMYGKYMFTANGALFLLNSFVFTISALSISFLIGNIINSKNAMSAASNVVSLGYCFISGVFVPQQYLGKTVLSIASFNPTYWYVKANNEISALVNFSKENLMPIFMSMAIILCFAIAIFAITLVIIKQKRLSN